MIEKVLLLSQIFGKEILMDLHVFMSSETENHIFGGWSVCMYVVKKMWKNNKMMLKLKL